MRRGGTWATEAIWMNYPTPNALRRWSIDYAVDRAVNTGRNMSTHQTQKRRLFRRLFLLFLYVIRFNERRFNQSAL